MGRHSRYGIVLDAGSSGTRIHIYEWDDPAHARKKAKSHELEYLPKIKSKKKWIKKIKPGISTLADTPDEVGEYLEPLFEHALEYIPSNAIKDTPVFLLATAGLRLVEERKRNVLMDKVCTWMRRNTGFLLSDCSQQIQMISGETEGLYGWIATNYLLGGFDRPDKHDHGKGHHTYGFLDMGGASAQLAFAPNSTETEKHADDLLLLRLRNIGGGDMEYKVFVTTWLGFGVNEARKEYLHRLIDASSAPGVEELPDPCLPKGLLATIEGKEIEDKEELAMAKRPYLVGTGRFDECLRQVYPLLGKDSPCHDAPCLLKGVHVPGIDFSVNHFVGVSEYWHTTHDIFQMGLDKKAYDLATYQKAVTDFCSLEWDSIESSVDGKKWGDHVDEEKAIGTCFKASWLINVLHEGIGVPRMGIEASTKTDKGFMNGAFQPVDKIDDVEVSWTLGKILLYAASQIPPPASVDSSSPLQPLPIGFGSNIPNRPYEIPADFQYANPLSTYSANTSSSSEYTDSPYYNSTSSEWNSSSASLHPSNHPLKTMFIFFLLAFLITYFLLGRDKRKKLIRRSKDFVHTIRGNRSKRWIPMLSLPTVNPNAHRGEYERVATNSSTYSSPYYHHSAHPSPAFELEMDEDTSDEYSDNSLSASSGKGGVASPVAGTASWRNEEGRLGVLGSLSASAGGSAVSLNALGKTRSRERYGRSRDGSRERS